MAGILFFAPGGHVGQWEHFHQSDMERSTGITRNKSSIHPKVQATGKFSRFTHETEKDKTENIFLVMTKLGKTKLGT